MCGGLSSDAKELDSQAGFEKAVTAIPLFQNGASIIYGVGATDAGSTISYTQMILDNEIIAGLRRVWQGIMIHDLEEEIKLIKSQIPRGNFMATKHTLQNYKRHWYPEILSRDTYDTWLEKGESIEDICDRKAKSIVADHNPQYLSSDVETEIERIMRKHISDFHF
jgi:trimethylamine--corrinoid protein Co-methyltransferase